MGVRSNPHLALQMFGTKTKGLFVDVTGETAFVARASGIKPPFTIEEIREISVADVTEGAEAIRAIAGARGTGYTTAVCAVYPASRLVGRVSIEPRKFREEGYMSEVVHEALKINPADYSLFTLSPEDGSDASAMKSPPRDLLVCGAPSDELGVQQERLLELGLYPQRMEIGTVSAVGGVVHYLALTESKAPTLLLEIGSETTNVFVVTRDGVEISRSVAFGINSMIPQIQRELTLKDEESARKLFFSNSFDFTGMGAQLTKRLVRELQASIGFFEVQTGQSVGQLACTLVPSKVNWLEQSLAETLGMKVLLIDHAAWLRSMDITVAEKVQTAGLGSAWTGLFCLMGQYKGRENEAAA